MRVCELIGYLQEIADNGGGEEEVIDDYGCAVFPPKVGSCDELEEGIYVILESDL